MHIKTIVFLIASFMASLLTGCGVHYPIDGQVIDTETKKPIQGAVIAINWQRYKVLSPPGLGPDRVEYGTSESVTNASGYFSIAKYTIGHFYMGVYKPGYICWSSDTIFNPTGKNHDEKYHSRHNFKIKSGMIIELQPKQGADFPVIEHARFICLTRTPIESRLFSDATDKECDLYWQDYRKRIGKDK